MPRVEKKTLEFQFPLSFSFLPSSPLQDFAAIENILVADSDDSSFLITFKSRRDAEIVSEALISYSSRYAIFLR